MPVVMCVLGHVLSCYGYAVPAFYCFLPVQYLIIYLYSNKLHSADIFYKQHIKIFVLSKL